MLTSASLKLIETSTQRVQTAAQLGRLVYVQVQ